MFKVVVTGPESTGKSEISRYLANAYGTAFIPEYAREYLAGLDRPYAFEDVERIARVQVAQLHDYPDVLPILFLDTYLIITKVWFRVVFGRIPEWIDESLERSGIDLFLLCYPDIKWVPDPLRENPDPRRSVLYEAYQKEILRLGTPCAVVRGSGKERFTNAENAVARHFTGSKTRI
jgi:nicotinamide riboside kinase